MAALGRKQLAAYCADWLTTPQAHEFAVIALNVGDDLRFDPTISITHNAKDGKAVIMPFDELLHFIVDRHFQGQQSLHDKIDAIRREMGDDGRVYKSNLGSKLPVYLACKNPACKAELKTQHFGYIGQGFHCDPENIKCPRCGQVHLYTADDLHFFVPLPDA